MRERDRSIYGALVTFFLASESVIFIRFSHELQLLFETPVTCSAFLMAGGGV